MLLDPDVVLELGTVGANRFLNGARWRCFDMLPTVRTENENMNKSAVESAAGDPVIQLVTFRLKDETYGINVMQVQEVLRVSEIAPVPGAPLRTGIINLRGNVVTVIDTRTRFGLPTTDVTTPAGS